MVHTRRHEEKFAMAYRAKEKVCGVTRTERLRNEEPLHKIGVKDVVSQIYAAKWKWTETCCRKFWQPLNMSPNRLDNARSKAAMRKTAKEVGWTSNTVRSMVNTGSKRRRLGANETRQILSALREWTNRQVIRWCPIYGWLTDIRKAWT